MPQYEHWFTSKLDPPCWLIADTETGDLLDKQLSDGRTVVIEYETEEALLRDYPTSVLSKHMGD